jgi:16S rRNA (guanine527-N7)-methyltransferase
MPPDQAKAVLIERLNVSRETLARLDRLVALLALWQRRINLVGPATLADAWTRHVLDSAQLLPHLPAGARRLVDIGSGAGFPGLVLALLGAPDVHLIESDRRKCAFLHEAARLTDAPVTVVPERVEAAAARLGRSADAVTARALAPLPRLVALAEPLLAPGGMLLALKGRRACEELTEARETWNMQSSRAPSWTDSAGVIVKLWDIHRADRAPA